MLIEFIDYVNSILPNVSPESRDAAKKAITQFNKEGHTLKYLTTKPLEQFSQGDILSKIPFTYFNAEGKQNQFTADAIVLSTSCHIDQKEMLVLSPIFPLESFKKEDTEKQDTSIIDLKNNIIYSCMYIPDGFMTEKYIDFRFINSYSKQLITTGMELSKINRIGSLNQLGYYLFIVKLAVYLMRKEDDSTLHERNIGFENY